MTRSSRLATTERFFPDAPYDTASAASPTEDGSWTIVLSGGAGERLRPTVRSWLGEDRPKQYCRFVGRRSMIEHAWIRARQVSSVDRMVTVVAPEHTAYLRELGYSLPGAIVSQPQQKGTAAGLFLPLSGVMARNRDAVVHVLPAGHFLTPNARFVEHMRAAAKVVSENPDQVVLAAAEPDRPEPEFGWIRPGRALRTASGAEVAAVEAMHHGLHLKHAREFLSNGYLWSTSILTARASTLWQLGSSHLPDVVWPFEQLRRAMRRGDAERDALRADLVRAYRRLPERDLYTDVLSGALDRCLVMPLAGVEWSDWGRYERLRISIERHGLEGRLEKGTVTPIEEAWALGMSDASADDPLARSDIA